MNTPPPTPAPSRAGAAAIVLLVTAIAFAWLATFCDPPRTHLDTARDWLLARDCTTVGCPSWGPVASVLGLHQGALWLRLLAEGLAAGLDATALQRLLQALQALGAGALAWGAWHLSGRRWGAALLAVGYVAFLRAVEPGDLLWNPQIAHPGAALFAVGWLGLAAGGGLAMAALAGLGAALASLGHVLGLILLPFLALGLALSRRRPLAALLVGFGVFAGVIALDSWDAAVADVAALHRAGLGLPMLGAVLVGALAGLPLRKRWAGLSTAWRLAAFLGLALLLATLAPAVIPGIVHVAEGSRFAFLAPPFAALALALGGNALIERRPERRRLASIALAIVLTLAGGRLAWHSEDHGGPEAMWRLPEVERLADDLYGRGATYAELFRRVQGPWESYLVATLAGLDPSPTPRDDDRGPLHGLLVLRFARSTVPTDLPAGWRRVDVSPGYVALLNEAPEALAADGFELCLRDHDAEPQCQAFDRRWREATKRPAVFSDRLYPHLAPDDLCRNVGPGSIRWSLPLEPSKVPRSVRLAAERYEGCTWALEAGSEEAHEVVLPPSTERPRVVVATSPAGSGCAARCAPPPLLVGALDDPILAAFLSTGDSRRPAPRRVR